MAELKALPRKLNDLNPKLLAAKYAVRGEVVDLARQLQKKLDSPDGHSLPFDKLYSCNIGNPQSLGQEPLTFNREVISLLVMPPAMAKSAAAFVSKEAVQRANAYSASIRHGGGLGAYTNSQGLDLVRCEVAAFIQRRDGYAADKDLVFLTDGASSGVKMLYQALITSEADGIMVPIPQYPLYSALCTLMGASLVGYYLNESARWAMQLDELERSILEAREAGKRVRALVVINPGNPTGQCMTVEGQQNVIRFCLRHGLVLLADEVYQENVIALDRSFTSFKKVVMAMGAEARPLRLVSFHSTSKGFIGECGFRGGYFEAHNWRDDVLVQLRKLASISLCPNTIGQISVGLMTNPPTQAESFIQYQRQKRQILSSLERRAGLVAAALNRLEGISCNPAEGAMYLFPQIHLPAQAVAAATAAGMAPDAFYCVEMLRNTGVVMVPGTGFKQAKGTYHFRMTFLPPEAEVAKLLSSLSAQHEKFMTTYRTGKAPAPAALSRPAVPTSLN